MHTAEATFDLLSGLGVNVWMVSRPQTAGNWKGGADALSTGEMGGLCLGLQRQWLQSGRSMSIGLEKFYIGNAQHAQRTRERVKGHTPDSLECPSTLWKLFLLPDGTILPCTSYTGTEVMRQMPNLLQTELADVLRDSSLRSFVCRQKKERLISTPECAECAHFSECGAGCGAYALSEKGALNKPDPFMCALYKGGWLRRFEETEESR